MREIVKIINYFDFAHRDRHPSKIETETTIFDQEYSSITKFIKLGHMEPKSNFSWYTVPVCKSRHSKFFLAR